jgi:hypothetical protein
LRHEANIAKNGGTPSIDAMMVANALFNAEKDTDVAAFIQVVRRDEPFIQKIENLLVNQNYDSYLSEFGLDPNDPLGDLNSKFKLPHQNAPLKYWIPHTYAFIARHVRALPLEHLISSDNASAPEAAPSLTPRPL